MILDQEVLSQSGGGSQPGKRGKGGGGKEIGGGKGERGRREEGEGIRDTENNNYHPFEDHPEDRGPFFLPKAMRIHRASHEQLKERGQDREII